MVNMFTALLNWLRGLFFAKELEVTLVGLQNAGECTPLLASRYR